MTARPAAAMLPDGRRLHLHHGPIDLIVEAIGPDRDRCYRQAIQRFETILIDLANELPTLRSPIIERHRFQGNTAKRMASAARRFDEVFVTPMAAVAGAVADEMLSTLIADCDVRKAYVNNGGDIAFHLTPGESMTTLGAAGLIEIAYDDPARGIATSGAGGRSHSLGIADAVTVIASTAAQADIAATLIANAVDLPDHPAIEREPASDLAPDSDLGDRLVTVAVGKLTDADIAAALTRGVALAERYRSRGRIVEAALSLRGRHELIAATSQREHAGAFVHA